MSRLIEFSIFIYILLAFSISWLAKYFFCLEDLGKMPVYIPKGLLQLIAAYGPSLAGIVIFALTHGIKSVNKIFKNLLWINHRVKWYLMAIFFELTTFILILTVAGFSGHSETNIYYQEIPASIIQFFVNMIILSILTGLGEEIGWRGFLLPALQLRFHVIGAAILLSLIISLWHLRTDDLAMLILGDYHGFCESYLPAMAQRILISIPIGFVIIYLFNKTTGSLVIMVLFHGSSNASWEWVKQLTGNSNPEYLLPLWTILLWLSAIYFVPALIRQARKSEVVTAIIN